MIADSYLVNKTFGDFTQQPNIEEVQTKELVPHLIKGNLSEDALLEEMISEGRVNRCGIVLEIYEDTRSVNSIAKKIQAHLTTSREAPIKSRKMTISYTNLELVHSVADAYLYRGKWYPGYPKIHYMEIAGSSVVSKFLFSEITKLWKWLEKYLSDEVRARLCQKKEDVDHRLFVYHLDENGKIPHTTKMIHCLQNKANRIDPYINVFYEGLASRGGTKKGDRDTQLMIGVGDKVSEVVQEFICIYGGLYNNYLSTEDNLRIGFTLEEKRIAKVVLIADENMGPQSIVCQILNIFHIPHPDRLDVRALKKILLKQHKGKKLYPMEPGKETGEKGILERALDDPKFTVMLINHFKENCANANLMLLGLIAVKVYQYGLEKKKKPLLKELGEELKKIDPKFLSGLPAMIDHLNREGRLNELSHFLNIHAYLYHFRKSKRASFLSERGHTACLTGNTTENLWKVIVHGYSIYIPYHPKESFVYLQKHPKLQELFQKFSIRFLYDPIPDEMLFEGIEEMGIPFHSSLPDLSFLLLISTRPFPYFAKYLFDFISGQESKKWVMDALVENGDLTKRLRQKLQKICRKKNSKNRFHYCLAMELFSQAHTNAAFEVLYQIPIGMRSNYGKDHFQYLCNSFPRKAFEEFKYSLLLPGSENMKLIIFDKIFPFFDKFTFEEKREIIEHLYCCAKKSSSHFTRYSESVYRAAPFAPSKRTLEILESLSQDKQIKEKIRIASIEAVWCSLFEKCPEIQDELILKAERLDLPSFSSKVAHHIFPACFPIGDYKRQKKIVRAVKKFEITPNEKQLIIKWFEKRMDDEKPESLWQEIKTQNYLNPKEINSLLIKLYRLHSTYVGLLADIDLTLCADEEMQQISTDECIKNLSAFEKNERALHHLLKICQMQDKIAHPAIARYLQEKVETSLSKKEGAKALGFLSYMVIPSMETLIQLIELGSFGYALHIYRQAIAGISFDCEKFLNEVFWEPFDKKNYNEAAEGITENLGFYREFAPFLNEYFLREYLSTPERHTCSLHFSALFILHQMPCKSEEVWIQFANSLTIEKFTQTDEGKDFCQALWRVVLKQMQDGGCVTKNTELFSLLYLNAISLIQEARPLDVLKVIDLTLVKDYVGLTEHLGIYNKLLGNTFIAVINTFHSLPPTKDTLKLMDNYRTKMKKSLLYPEKDEGKMKKALSHKKNLDHQKLCVGRCIEFQYNIYFLRLEISLIINDKQEMDHSLEELFEGAKAIHVWTFDEIFELIKLILKIPKLNTKQKIIYAYLIYRYISNCKSDGKGQMSPFLFKALQQCPHETEMIINEQRINFIDASFDCIQSLLQQKAPLEKETRLHAILLLNQLVKTYLKACEKRLTDLMKDRDNLTRHPDFFDLPFYNLFNGRFPTTINGQMYEYNYGIYFYWQYRNDIQFPIRHSEKFIKECLNAPEIHHTKDNIMEVIDIVRTAFVEEEGNEGYARLIRILTEVKKREVTVKICLEEITKYIPIDPNQALEFFVNLLAKVPCSLPIDDEKTINAVNRVLEKAGFPYQSVNLSTKVKTIRVNPMTALCKQKILELNPDEKGILIDTMIKHDSYQSLIWLVNLFHEDSKPSLVHVFLAIRGFFDRYQKSKSIKLCTGKLDILKALFDLHIKAYKNLPIGERFLLFSLFEQAIEAAGELLENIEEQKEKSDPFLFEVFRYLYHMRRISILMFGTPKYQLGKVIVSFLDKGYATISCEALLDPKNIRMLMNYLYYCDDEELNEKFRDIYRLYVGRVKTLDKVKQAQVILTIQEHIRNIKTNLYFKVGEEDDLIKVANTIEQINRESV